jgi:hypothetical protein
MTNLVPFNQSQAPSFLQVSTDQVRLMNAGAAVGTGGGGVNKISLKQCRFRLIVGGNEVAVLPNISLDVVAVRANGAASKTFYLTAWNPNDEPVQPDCSSDDGIRPRTDSKLPQCGADGLCQNCQWNQWGSKINTVTGGKVKACADTKRVAIIAPGTDGRFAGTGDAYQLNIPPASLGEWGAYVRGLSAMATPVPYNAVVTRVSFDTKAEFPRLLFEGVRYLEPDEYQAVLARYDTDVTCRTAGLPDPATSAPNPSSAPQLQHQQPQQQVQQPQPPQQQVQQPQQQVHQPAAQGGWGEQQQQVQQPQQQVQQPQQQVQQPAAQGGWGEQQQQVQQPQQQVQQPQQQVQQPAAQGGWGAQQQQVQQPQQQVQQPQQQATGARSPSGRVYGQPAEGKSRRNSADVAEDKAYFEGTGAAQPQQQAQQVQQPAAQGGWGGETVAVQQPAAQGGWGEQQQQPQQQVQQPAAQGGWGEQQPQQGGATNQPNTVSGGFAGWDDQ